MARVADGERWMFEIDPQNHFTLALEKVGTRRITVTASSGTA